MRWRNRVALVSLGCAVAACAGHDRDGGSDPVTRQAVRGRVVGADGCYADSMPVTLTLADAAATVVDRTRTAFDGSFTVQATTSTPHRLVVGDDPSQASVITLDVPPGVGTIERRVELEPSQWTKVAGMLLDAEGRKLPLSAIARLLPGSVGHDPNQATQSADGFVEYFPFTGASRLVARFDHGGLLSTGEPKATVDPASARFEILVPAAVGGRLALDFRGRELAWVPFDERSGLVEFFVDDAEAFRSLGSLELSLPEEDRSVALDRIVVLRRDGSPVPGASDPAAEFFRVDGPTLPMRLIGIPAGRYTVILQSTAGTTARHEVDVSGDAAVALALDLRAESRASITLVDRRTASARSTAQDLAAGCELRTLDGLPLPATIEATAAGDGLLVSEAPAGQAVLLSGAGHVVVELRAGEETTASLTLDDLVASEIRVRLFDGWRWKLPAAIPARLRILAGGDVVVSDSRIAIEHSADGWATVALETPPGDFRVLFDAGDFRRVDETIRAGFVTVLR